MTIFFLLNFFFVFLCSYNQHHLLFLDMLLYNWIRLCFLYISHIQVSFPKNTHRTSDRELKHSPISSPLCLYFLMSIFTHYSTFWFTSVYNNCIHCVCVCLCFNYYFLCQRLSFFLTLWQNDGSSFPFFYMGLFS